MHFEARRAELSCERSEHDIIETEVNCSAERSDRVVILKECNVR